MQDKKKKKILYVITKSNFGGAQRSVLDLAKASRDAGISVVVACGGLGNLNTNPGKLQKLLYEQKITTIFIKNFVRDMSIISDIKATLELYSIIKKECPDILHVSSSKAGGIGALLGRILKIKNIIFTSHGLTFDEIWRPRFQIYLIKIFTWFTCLLAHTTIVISRDNEKRLRAFPFLKEKVVMIYNGIENITFLNRDSARKKLYSPNKCSKHNNDFWLISSGELTPNKDHISAIDAVIAFNKIYRDKIFFTIMGSGELELETKQYIKDQNAEDYITILGYIDDGAKYFKAYDGFIITSKKEGLPYVVLEAGLAGLPVIASDIPGNTEIITHEVRGLITNATVRHITKTLERFVLCKNESKQLGINLQKYIKNNFSIETMIKKTLTLYDI